MTFPCFKHGHVCFQSRASWEAVGPGWVLGRFGQKTQQNAGPTFSFHQLGNVVILI